MLKLLGMEKNAKLQFYNKKSIVTTYARKKGMDFEMFKETEITKWNHLQELISQAQRTLNVGFERFGLGIFSYYNEILK